MKQLVVKENGMSVFMQTCEENETLTAGEPKFNEYSQYFKKLILTIGEISENVNLVYNITENLSLMTLFLTEEQLSIAEEIKKALFESFSNDIKIIEIIGNQMNIYDFLYKAN